MISTHPTDPFAGLLEHRSEGPPDVSRLDFKGLKVLIFGLRSFGGGAGAARFFATRGATVTITDRQSSEQLEHSRAALEDVPIAHWHLGGHDPIDFDQNDWIVVNPAVPPTHPLLHRAEKTRKRLVTEIGLFLRWCPSSHVAAITGSNGKSTTAQLTHDILVAAGHKVHLGGNIGRSLLPCLADIEVEHRVVLELSSFQLARLKGVRAPRAVAITGLSANHIDWHGSYDAYASAKEEVLKLSLIHI